MVIIIACVANNGVIGKNGKIPWSLATDLERFKSITLHSALIIGSKTYESIGKPLPNRFNIVLSRTKELLHYESELGKGDVVTVQNKDHALVLGRSCGNTFIIGGAEIYKLFMEEADKLYLSVLPIDYEGDVYFPEIDPNKWKVDNTELIKDDFMYYKFIQFVRI